MARRVIQEDGFVWEVLTKQQARKHWKDPEAPELYAIYDDDTESAIESLEDLQEAFDNGCDVGYEVGFDAKEMKKALLEHQISSKMEVTQNRLQLKKDVEQKKKEAERKEKNRRANMTMEICDDIMDICDKVYAELQVHEENTHSMEFYKAHENGLHSMSFLPQPGGQCRVHVMWICKHVYVHVELAYMTDLTFRVHETSMGNVHYVKMLGDITDLLVGKYLRQDADELRKEVLNKSEYTCTDDEQHRYFWRNPDDRPLLADTEEKGAA
jgi:molecular chaperone GrpE (heat shock protein)